jgi:hypothetical protein
MKLLRNILFKYYDLIIKNDYILASLFAFFLCIVVFWPTFSEQKLPLATDILTGYNLPWKDIPFEGQPFPFPVKNLGTYDTVRQMYPWKFLSIQQYGEGRWPLWNPTQLSGTPLAAEFLTGAFYPLNILFVFFTSFAWGYGILAILQIFIIFITTFLFLRSITLSRPPSLFGATVFSLSGFIAGFFSTNVMIHALAWTPLALFSVNKIFKKGNLFWLFILASSISLIGLASHMQIFLYSTILVTTYIFFNYFKKKNSKILLISLLGIFIGILLTSIQLLPSLELLSLSSRSGNYGSNTSINLPTQNLLLLFAPDYFGNPGKQNYFGPISYYHEFSFYVGIPTLIFTLLAASLIRKNKEVLFWVGVFLTTIILTTNNFISKLPSDLNMPVLGSLTPTRAYAYTCLALAILGSIGFDKLFRNKIRHSISILVIFTLLSFITFSIMLLNVLNPGMFFWKFLWDTTASHVQTSLRNLIIPFSITISTILLIGSLLVFKAKRWLYFVLICLYLIVTIDLLRQFAFQNGFVSPKSVFPETKITQFLSSHTIPPRIISLEDRILSPNVGAYYGWENIDGYDPNYVASYANTYSKYDSVNFESKKKFGKMISTIYPESHVIDRLGVNYILTNYSLEKRLEKDYRKVMHEGDVIVYENINSVPRFTFSETDSSDLTDINFSKNAKVIFPQNNANDLEEPSEIEILDYQPDLIKLNVTNTSKGQTLQTMIINYPGWEAYINDQKTPLIVSDEGFIGVQVPDNNSTITFRFRSFSFNIGLLISACTLLTLILFVILGKKKRFY